MTDLLDDVQLDAAPFLVSDDPSDWIVPDEFTDGDLIASWEAMRDADDELHDRTLNANEACWRADAVADLLGEHGVDGLSLPSRIHEHLRVMWKMGLTTRVIARLAGVNVYDLMPHAFRQAPRDQWEAVLDAEHQLMHDPSKTLARITELTGVSADQLNWMRHNRKCVVRQTPVHPARARCLELAAQGLKPKQIHERVTAEGFDPVPSRQTITSWVHRHKPQAVAA